MSSTLFTTSDGDVILRAGADPNSKYAFRAHKLIMSLASPVFKDMFSFPQPPDKTQNGLHGIPTIDVPDSPEVLDVILRFIYPGVEPPKFTDLSILSGLLSAADKYDIASMQPTLRDALKTFIPREPLRVYIIACRFGFLEEAKAAAKILTPRKILLQKDHEKEIRQTSGADLYRLIWFINQREEAVRVMVTSFTALYKGFYECPCPIEEPWSSDTVDVYVELGRKLVDAFTKTPCARGDEFDWASDELLNLPHCQRRPLDDDDDEIDCPHRPFFIGRGISRIVWDLNRTSDELLKEAFGKEF